MSFTVIIPARYQSTRLPGKVLLDIAGKPMIQHIYEQAVKSGADEVIIATEDEHVEAVAQGFGAPVCMTASDHPTGTDRIAEVAEELELDDNDVIIGLQGDEPLITASMIRALATDIVDSEQVKMASLCRPVQQADELFDPSKVKVVLNKRHYALYFSRAPIAWDRQSFHNPSEAIVSPYHFIHLGIYAYRANFLRQYVSWEQTPVEKLESLEQLRVLHNGGRIHMVVSSEKTIPIGVDTQEDLDQVRKQFK